MKIIKIGRSQTNDCIFENQSVSGSHAVLTVNLDGQSAILRDLNSTNGTYVNNNPQKINGDVTIGLNDTLCFGSEKTSLKEILEKSNKTKIQSSFGGCHQPGVCRKTIGKNPENDIVLVHNDVSRKHAILYKDANGNVVIEDLGSTNGTYVNGIKVTSKILQTGDQLSITRNYPLVWEKVFGNNNSLNNNLHKSNNNKTVFLSVAAIFVVAIIGLFTYVNRPWSKEKIYKEYNNAVCWVTTMYGYQIFLDDKDFTSMFSKMCEIPYTGLIHIEGDKIVSGGVGTQGTAFFISKDGKLATNLHVTRPWMFSSDMETLRKHVNKIVGLMGAQNPLLARSEVKVKGVRGKLCIVLNGLPITESNLIECDEIEAYDNPNKDVAIIQTTSRELPSRVNKIIDIKNADNSEDALTEGSTIFTIGYPYGVTMAVNSSKEIRNQVHEGSITQKRGDFEFGHDAATAGGASGSPLFNDKGKLIGIHHAGMTGVTGAQGFNMGIKVKYIEDLLK